MANPFFSGRIPKALAEKVDTHLAITGETRSELLLRLLRQEVSDNNTDNDNERDSILTDLLQRVAKLEQMMGDNAVVITEAVAPITTAKKPRTSRSKKVVKNTTIDE
jgi:hypothetical protein